MIFSDTGTFLSVCYFDVIVTLPQWCAFHCALQRFELFVVVSAAADFFAVVVGGGGGAYPNSTPYPVQMWFQSSIPAWRLSNEMTE